MRHLLLLAVLFAVTALPLGAVAAPKNNQPPTVSFKAPLAGQVLSGTVSGAACEAIATDDRSVRRVEFRVDDTLLNTETGAPWNCTLDTTRFTNGSHTLKAVAYDQSGASGSAEITVNIQNGPANSPPTVSFSTPSNGQTVSGSLQCEALAADDKGVSQVQFFLDTTPLNTDLSSPWQCNVDTTLFANGTHLLKALAMDTDGATGAAQISINVQNVAPNSPPTVSFSTPSNGQTVSGSLQCEALAADDKGVAQVQFFLDATALDTDLSAPWQCNLDTTRFANGTHVLQAIATDAEGANGTAQISIDIQNAPVAAKAAAIATFHSLGLYWTPPSDPGAQGCLVRYRAQGAIEWKDALPMWYDARNGECRGSIVHLAPGTTYAIELSMPGQPAGTPLSATTWSENFPIARVVEVPSGSTTLAITEGGTPEGYVLYTSPAGSQSTLDAADAQDFNVTISAPYVIVRGLILRGARQDGIRLLPGAHDVVIEDNDISGWGRYRTTLSNGWQVGMEKDSAVRAVCTSFPAGVSLERTVIQRNRMHDPRYTTNSWDFGHPTGPQAVSYSSCGGNHVIRHNEIYSADSTKYLNDAIGGSENFSNVGFPNSDSDIYGNRISHVWDDAIEAEGANRNVRIWSNYTDRTNVGVATTATSVGPVYVFRNVINRSQKLALQSTDTADRVTVFKSGSTSTFGDGRRYVFHNTLLQATQAGLTYPLGAGEGIAAAGSSQPLTNTVSRNNILHIWKSWWTSIRTEGGSGNDFDYDLHNGGISAYPGAEANGIVGTPIYAPGHGWTSESNGLYELAPGSPGYDAGVRLPNFNDDFTGAAPDMGAHEAGSAAMRFGVR